MKTAIDRSGRVLIPKRIRERLGLEGGESLEVVEQGGVIELHRAPIEVEIVTTPSGSVARAKADVEQIDDEIVRDVLERVRR